MKNDRSVFTLRNYADLEFARVGEKRLLLDLIVPEDGAKPAPLIIWIHGGGWEVGVKEWQSPVQGMEAALLERGCAIASISYRLSHEAIFPAQLEDCKAAVRWLRAHGSEYGLSTDRIGVVGHSAGGHLTALLGTTGGHNAFDVGENRDVSSRVQAVCPMSAPTAFMEMGGSHLDPDSPESRLIGAPVLENPALVARANPITYVSKDSPPFLLLHGDRDDVVAYSQSQLLHDALVNAGADSTLYIVRGGDHDLNSGSDAEIRNIVRMIVDFFDRHLK
jgi:acetyl esterase/lipase